MVKRRLMFTFTPELLKEPIIYGLGQQFNLATNIQRADIADERGWALVELEGTVGDIEEAIAWVTGRGMRIDPAGEYDI